jgi:hypothetical protein
MSKLNDLYRAKQQYQYADRLTRHDLDEIARLEAEIAVLETKQEPAARRVLVAGPTIDDALCRIRMWAGLKRMGFYRNKGK